MTKNVVGLFGTCGSSTWREGVIAKLNEAGIPFFNPQLPSGVAWVQEVHGAAEADHAVTDKVVLNAITPDTEAYGALAEVGFMLMDAKENGQTVIVVIQDFPADPDPKMNRKHPANRERALVKEHMARRGFKVYTNLDEATSAVVEAFKS